MANIKTAKIGTDNIKRTQKCFHNVFVGKGDGPEWTPHYIHLKTNMPSNAYHMFLIEALGYNYGTSSPIQCAWGAYGYIDNIIHNIALHTIYGAIYADGIYRSADNFIVLRAFTSSLYYANFTLDAYFPCPTNVMTPPDFEVAITATAANSNSGAHF